MFTNATDKFWSLVMNGLADVDGFKICIWVCVWLGFPPLVNAILLLVYDKVQHREWSFADENIYQTFHRNPITEIKYSPEIYSSLT